MRVQEGRDGLGDGAVEGEWIGHGGMEAARRTNCQDRQNVSVHVVTVTRLDSFTVVLFNEIMFDEKKTRPRRPYLLRRRAETAEETRRRIVEATFALHAEHGVAATTMTHIAKRAGVGIGTVYHHFPALDQTVAACTAYAQETAPLPTDAIFAGAKSMRERVLRLVTAMFDYFDLLPGFERVRADQDKVPAVQSFMVAEERQRIELTRTALAPFAVDRDLIRIIAALLDAAVYRGLQRTGLSMEAAAAAIADVIHARLTRKD
ncbi:MAG: TetR/AcrR family transcriptional regulator [Dongiaceae bacterium]